MSSQKIGIVCSGGGMKCCYGAGVLHALAKEYQFSNPHVVVGASGSAGPTTLFVSRQYDHMEEYFHALSLRHITSFSRLPFVDIAYFVNTIIAKRHPIDTESYRTSDTTHLVPVTSLSTGEVLYYSNRDPNLLLYSALIAAQSIPLLCGSAARVFTDSAERYVDGDLGQKLPLHVEHAFAAGAERVIVIDNQPESYWWMVLGARIYGRFFAPKILSSITQGLAMHDEMFLDDPRIIYVAPSQDLPTKMFTRSKKRMLDAFNIGRKDAQNHAGLHALLR